MKTLKRRIETSGYRGRPITGVDLQPVKYGSQFIKEAIAVEEIAKSVQTCCPLAPAAAQKCVSCHAKCAACAAYTMYTIGPDTREVKLVSCSLFWREKQILFFVRWD